MLDRCDFSPLVVILSFSFRGCQIVADVFDLLTVLLAGQSNKLYELQNLCEHFTLTTLHYHLPHMLFLKCPDVCVCTWMIFSSIYQPNLTYSTQLRVMHTLCPLHLSLNVISHKFLRRFQDSCAILHNRTLWPSFIK